MCGAHIPRSLVVVEFDRQTSYPNSWPDHDFDTLNLVIQLKMILRTCWPALAILLVGLAATAKTIPFYNKRYCGTDDPSPHLVSTHRYLHDNEPKDNDLWNSSSLLTRQHMQSHSHSHSKRQAANPYYTIDTYFHVVADSSTASPSSSGYVTDAMVAAQFTFLAQAYTNASIGFRLRGVTRSVNDTWAANGDDQNMKTALRNGTYSSLNVYYQSQLQESTSSPGVPAGSTLLGFCSLPALGVTATLPPAAYVLDGCNILSSTMPGGSFTGYNQGGTTAHEVGHWNGLLHPFQDNTCDPNDFGDYVADTPQEQASTSRFNEIPSTFVTLPLNDTY